MLKKINHCALIVALIAIIGNNLYSFSVAYFSPDDHPTKKLISLIDSAKKTIYAAVYMLTDKNIAQALIRAKNERKIDVQIITDNITITSIYGKGNFLAENNIIVYGFNPPEKTIVTKEAFYMAPAIMHHKFALIDDCVWNGSFNWTRAADQKNTEDVIVTDDKDIFSSFKKQFEKLKEKCRILSPSSKKI